MMLMKYNGYEVTERGNSIIIENVKDFNPVHVFECGQCFRWIKQDDGSYTGTAVGRAVNVSFSDGVLRIDNSNVDDFKNIWFDYFDLGRDYSEIKARLAKDEIMKNAVEFGHGIRILKQDIWETLISFIISANNRIPMIKKVVDSISRAYGEKITFDGKTTYTFPSAKALSNADLEHLKACRGGFRCKYILAAANAVRDKGIDLDLLCRFDTDSARCELMRLPGVGNKVADCTLLFSGVKYDVFPVDVWVKRVMEELYLKKEASFKEIQEFAADYFGNLAGFAQQYLFYYARENRIGAG
jgi:N-glycosylase/DNA lyase